MAVLPKSRSSQRDGLSHWQTKLEKIERFSACNNPPFFVEFLYDSAFLLLPSVVESPAPVSPPISAEINLPETAPWWKQRGGGHESWTDHLSLCHCYYQHYLMTQQASRQLRVSPIICFYPTHPPPPPLPMSQHHDLVFMPVSLQRNSASKGLVNDQIDTFCHYTAG